MTEWPPGSCRARRAVSRCAGSWRGRIRPRRLRLVDHHEAHAAGAAWASGFPVCASLTIDGLATALRRPSPASGTGGWTRVAASPARHSLGVFFEHVTNLLNMRELEDEGKVMALADYAAPIADADNPLLRVDSRPRRSHRDRVARPCAAARRSRRFTGGRANEQFAYMAQRVVEHVCVALARDAVRLTGLLAPRARRRRRFEREGDAPRQAAAGSRGPLRLPAHGRWRACAWRRRARGGREPATACSSISVGSISGLVTTSPPSRRRCATPGSRRRRAESAGRGRGSARRRAHRDVVPGAHGVRAARAWPSQRAGAAGPARPARSAQPGAEAPGAGTSRSARACSRARRRGCSRLDGRREPVHDDGVPGRARAPRRTGRRHRVSTEPAGRNSSPDDEAERVRANCCVRARRRWGIGAVLNTSFNIHGEPLVCTPREAVDVFLRSGADALAIGPFLVQPARAWIDSPDPAIWPMLVRVRGLRDRRGSRRWSRWLAGCLAPPTEPCCGSS